jgi:hypothetical protein
MRQHDPSFSASEAKVLEDIAEYGLHIVHVLEDDDDAEDAARFSYTVGLHHSLQHPEVIVFGLPEDVAHELLNLVADEISEGKQFAGGTRHEGLLEGYPVRFVDIGVENHKDHVGLARWAYEDEAFSVVQLVYPDQQGRWPWDEGIRDGFRRHQPVLGKPESRA